MEQRHAKEQDGWKTTMVQRSLEQYIPLAALRSVALEMNCPIKKEPYHKRTGANKYKYMWAGRCRMAGRACRSLLFPQLFTKGLTPLHTRVRHPRLCSTQLWSLCGKSAGLRTCCHTFTVRCSWYTSGLRVWAPWIQFYISKTCLCLKKKKEKRLWNTLEKQNSQSHAINFHKSLLLWSRYKSWCVKKKKGPRGGGCLNDRGGRWGVCLPAIFRDPVGEQWRELISWQTPGLCVP